MTFNLWILTIFYVIGKEMLNGQWALHLDVTDALFPKFDLVFISKDLINQQRVAL